MSRITKEIASAVAKELVQPKQEEKMVLQALLKDHLRNYFLTTIPEDVLIEFHKNPNYFNTTHSIRIQGEGITDSYNYYSIGEELPYSRKTDRVLLPPKVAAAAVKLIDAIKDKKYEIEKLIKEIEVALYNLRTYKNVENEFPEAFKRLPPTPLTTALAINLKDIRCKLDKTVCE
jgi:hypothetical protein